MLREFRAGGLDLRAKRGVGADAALRLDLRLACGEKRGAGECGEEALGNFYAGKQSLMGLDDLKKSRSYHYSLLARAQLRPYFRNPVKHHVYHHAITAA